MPENGAHTQNLAATIKSLRKHSEKLYSVKKGSDSKKQMKAPV